MKKIAVLFLVVVLAFSMLFVGCDNSETISAKHGDSVIITVSATYQVKEGETLIDYMNSIKGRKELSSYTVQDGMVTEINNVKASGSTYWMLFTDDAENSNEAWGSVEIDNKTYYSAVSGAEQLLIKAGCTYVWQAQNFGI